MPLLLSPFGYSTYRRRHVELSPDVRDLSLEPLRQVARPAGQGPSTRAMPHELVDLTIDVQLEGAFEPVYVDGDNRLVPRDRHDEEHRLRARAAGSDRRTSRRSRCGWRITSLAKPAVSRVRISGGRAAVGRGCRSRRTAASARVRRSRAASTGRRSSRATRARQPTIVSGLDEPRRAEDDRLGVLGLSARRVHDAAGHRGSHPGDVDHRDLDVPSGHRPTSARATRIRRRAGRDVCRARQPLGAAHAVRDGRGRAGGVRDIAEITLTLPNRHHLLVDLTPFGLDNPNEIFVATDQPFGLDRSDDSDGRR